MARDFMPKGRGGSSPMNVILDEVPFDRIEAYRRDQRKTALLAAGNIGDREHLCDVLEMIGFEIKPEARVM